MAEKRSRAKTSSRSKTAGRSQPTAEQQTERTQEAHRLLLDAVEKLTTSEDWMKVLEMSRRQPSYSPKNCLMLAVQDAQGMVMGYQAWRTVPAAGGGFCQVKRGAKGLKILAPVTRTSTEVNEVTGEEAKVTRPVGFKLISVFDEASLVIAPDIPEPDLSRLLQDEAPADLWEALAVQVAAAGYRLDTSEEVIEKLVEANGLTDYELHVVSVRPDRSPAQRTKTLAHELAHIHLHHPAVIPDGMTRRLAEVEAESVAFLVVAELGLDSSAYSVPYLAGWADGDSSLVLSTADRAVKTARQISEAVSAYLKGTELPEKSLGQVASGTRIDVINAPGAGDPIDDLNRLYDSPTVLRGELVEPPSDARARGTAAPDASVVPGIGVDEDAVAISTPAGRWYLTWQPEHGTFSARYVTTGPDSPDVGTAANARHVSRVLGALHRKINSMGALEQHLGFALPSPAREHLMQLQTARPAALTGGRDFSGLHPGDLDVETPATGGERPTFQSVITLITAGQVVSRIPYMSALDSPPPLRRWSSAGYTVEILDSERQLDDEFNGDQALTYRLSYDEKVVFSGDEILAPIDVDPASDFALEQVVLLLTDPDPDDGVALSRSQNEFLAVHADALRQAISLPDPPYSPNTRVALAAQSSGRPPITGCVIRPIEDARGLVTSYAWRPDVAELPGHPWSDNESLALVTSAGDITATLAHRDTGLRGWNAATPLAFGAVVVVTGDHGQPPLSAVIRAFPTESGFDYDVSLDQENPALAEPSFSLNERVVRVPGHEVTPVIGTAWPTVEALVDHRAHVGLNLHEGEVLCVQNEIQQAVAGEDGVLVLVGRKAGPTGLAAVVSEPPTAKPVADALAADAGSTLPTEQIARPCASPDCFDSATATVSVGWPQGLREIADRCTPCASRTAVEGLSQGCAVDIRPFEQPSAPAPTIGAGTPLTVDAAAPGAGI